MLTSLRARFVFPVDQPPIEHGVVTFENERIVSIGKQPISGGTDIQNLGDVALVPGLVNTHTHLEFSDLRRPLGMPGMPLAEWIRLVIAGRARRNGGRSNEIAAGLRESLRHGVTTIGEIGTVDTPAPYGAADATVFLEAIGFSRARAPSAASAVVARLEEFDRAGRIRAGISPHAPYTVSPALLQMLVGVACERNLPVAMHLAESTDEIELLNRGVGAFQELLEERSMWDAEAIPRGSRPLDYLRRLSDAPRSLVIHGNYLADDEQDCLADHRDRMSLVYCPRTHAYFGHSPYPLSALLARGVNVALGTDSRASSPDLDLLAEARQVAATHAAVKPHDILQMGTLAGAVALGQDNEVGSLAQGKLANLVALPVSDRGDAAECLAEIFSHEHEPSAVWIRGVRLS